MTRIAQGSGNVFADLGLPHPEELLAKAKLVSRIIDTIDERGLTQTQAGKVLGVDQAKISTLKRGQFDGFSMERLIRFLNALDRDVEIVVKPKSRRRKTGGSASLQRHRVTPAPSTRFPLPR